MLQKGKNLGRSGQTRQIALEAAIDMLYEVGYSATTTISIAKRAGISRGALMHHFGSKADIMTYVVEAVYQEEIGIYRQRFEHITEPRAYMLALPETVWSVLSRPAGIAALEVLQGSRSDTVLAIKLRPVQQRIESDARSRVEQGIGAAASLAFMRLVVSACRGLSIRTMIEPGAKSEEAIALLRKLIEIGLDTGTILLPEEMQRTPQRA